MVERLIYPEVSIGLKHQNGGIASFFLSYFTWIRRLIHTVFKPAPVIALKHKNRASVKSILLDGFDAPQKMTADKRPTNMK